MPDFAVVDTHVHLYDPMLLRHSWMNSLPKINRRFDLSHFDAARDGVEIERIVFIEVGADMWGQHIAEARWVDGSGGNDPRLQAIVAAAPLERGIEALPDLEALHAIGRVKGIRRLIEAEAEPGFCTRPAFVEGVKLLPRFGFSFDICIRHHQMRDAIELVRECPQVQFILDHIGKPAIRDGVMEPWRSEIAEMARLPNVACKLSGVITEADHKHWTREDIRPYLEHVIDCFGFDRLMYGSDWTVSSLTHSYADWVRILDEVTESASKADRRKLFHDNAIRYYRLDG